MQEPSFRQKTYTCQDPKTHKKEVNCIYWSVNKNDCINSCSINIVKNPSHVYCTKCEKRVSYPHDVLEEDKKSYKFANITVSAKPDLQKAKSYVKAESSQFWSGKVDDVIYNERKENCMSCPKRINPVADKEDEIGWCNSCGCGLGTERAKLSVKLRMPAVFCPLGKFTAAIGSGFKIEDAVDALGGTIKTISKFIKPS